MIKKLPVLFSFTTVLLLFSHIGHIHANSTSLSKKDHTEKSECTRIWNSISLNYTLSNVKQLDTDHPIAALLFSKIDESSWINSLGNYKRYVYNNVYQKFFKSFFI